MSSINSQQKKEWAKLIYVKERATQKEIASKVGISEQSLSKWIRAEKWEILRQSVVVTKEEQLSRLYMQITELNDLIMGRDKGCRFANAKEADTLIKLTAAIKNLETETSISDIIDVAMKLLAWLRGSDIQKAKELSIYIDRYIKEKLIA
jgi:DNA-binding XRE family transcriptional regulator